ncbi:hypothetical protein GY21_00880 [Cryobacterium roopkundense]|uniref:Uncharacterized protein n=1 Tax=Cryobacterium roopkundense TaxID=1001240 RepID=A0A099JW84_9MICO|nr:hypothetical protein GY21_00880 [Cryobacterium roopkundense]
MSEQSPVSAHAPRSRTRLAIIWLLVVVLVVAAIVTTLAIADIDLSLAAPAQGFFLALVTASPRA